MTREAAQVLRSCLFRRVCKLRLRRFRSALCPRGAARQNRPLPRGTAFAFSSPVKIVTTFVAAFGDGFTYDPRRNVYLWFGVLWGIPVPCFSMAIHYALTDEAPSPALFVAHPWHLIFLLHPPIFGLVFGAMGTIRRNLERENERLIETLRGMAMTDPLTGLYNRRYLLDQLRHMLASSLRTHQPLVVAMFDLDDFKAVNDTQGHLTGDRVLRAVAASLQSAARQSDVLGRYGGDEFLMVVQGTREGAALLAERAAEAVKRQTTMSISKGLGVAPDDGATPEELIGAADRMLAETKRRRREGQGSVRQ